MENPGVIFNRCTNAITAWLCGEKNITDAEPMGELLIEGMGEVVKKFELQEQIKLLRWPAHDPEFTPALLDHRYKQWTYYGITAVCKIVKTKGA